MSKSIKEISQIAAEWWGEKVIKPTFENGDNSESSVLAGVLATMATEKVDNAAKEKFILKLSNTIEEKLNSSHDLILSVDYGPCKDLFECAKYAGIVGTNFPWKTTMQIHENCVRVSCGYRGNLEYLYANKEYWENKIKSAKESIKLYKTEDRFKYLTDNEEDKKKWTKEEIERLENDIKGYQKKLEKAEN